MSGDQREKLLNAIREKRIKPRQHAEFMSSIDLAILDFALEGIISTDTFLQIYGGADNLTLELTKRYEDLMLESQPEKANLVNDYLMLKVLPAQDYSHA